MNPEKLRRLQEKVRTGGKGSVRRKRKITHKGAQNDDKKLHQVLKRQGLQPIQGIEEVNLIKHDDTVIHFSKLKPLLNCFRIL